ncbi:hypothetical protein HT031_003271 [Scenedesmus sp. PABB004]|nr:hypothetical protein HT031_003271 [Scenedesmus sp. PABB004]
MQASRLSGSSARAARAGGAGAGGRRAAPPRAGRRRVAAAATYPRDEVEQVDDPASPVAAQALQEYFQLERAGPPEPAALASLRLKYGIRRGPDGRVSLRTRGGTWMQAKLDMEVKGTMLLRNCDDSSVHVLQTDKLEQIDLSDDYLLLMLFADGGWEETTTPIQLSGEDGRPEALTVGEQQFKDFVGMLKTLQEMEDGFAAGGDDGDDAAGGGAGGGPRTIDVTAEPANGR